MSNIWNKKENLEIINDKLPIYLKHTYNNKVFTRFNFIDEKIKLLYTDAFAEYLKMSDKWICEWYFLFCTAESFQLYFLCAKYFYKTYPFLHVFLNDKKEKTYLQLFNKVKETVNVACPGFLKIDSEKSVYNAFKIVFPTTEIFLCVSHFSNSLYRIATKFVFANTLNINKNIMSLVGC